MKKKLAALGLALALICALPVPPARAAYDETGAEQTVRALGIMVGDTSGSMNLDAAVTRAQFSKMLVMASSYHDSIGDDGAGYSLFKDVKSSHWASEYIKIAVEEGWIVGYTDGSFRPEQGITLEQACTMALRLLGYDSSTLAGSYPAAQLSKAASLGLRDQITLSRGGAMTRRDCMNLFYNLLTAQTSDGKTYAAAIGYTVTNGQVDYAAVVESSLSGPYVCEASAPTLPFTPAAVYLDGVVSTLSALSQYDVYYYNANLQTVWICTDRVSGAVTALSPSATAPTAVTVSGNSYQIGTASATYKLSAMGGTAVGDTVMLLLGMDGTVADVVTGTEIDTTCYGVVQSYTNTSSSTGDAAAQTQVAVACTDGVVHTFTVDGKKTYSAGAVVSASVNSNGTTIRTLTSPSLTGTVNGSGTALGSLSFASGVRILDTASDGSYAKLSASRLAGCALRSGAIRYYALNEAGEISDLILNDVTGDTWQYGFMLSVDKAKSSDSVSFSVTYTYLMGDVKKTLSTSNSSYPINTSGGFALRTNSSGSVSTMRTLTSVRLTALGSIYATAGSQKYRVADDVQVYLYADGSYYATTLSAVNDSDYSLTGWYDSFGSSAGNRIRVLVATAN